MSLWSASSMWSPLVRHQLLGRRGREDALQLLGVLARFFHAYSGDGGPVQLVVQLLWDSVADHEHAGSFFREQPVHVLSSRLLLLEVAVG